MIVLDWLLDSDPGLRWQVLRDLTAASPGEIAAERARVAVEGWGARLLALRGGDGQWAGGACFPADFRGDFSAGQPWTSTLPTLTLLRDLGVDPHAEQIREAVPLVRDNCRWEHAGQPFFAGEVEPCINGRTVAIGAYFGVDVAGIVRRLIGEQLADGGWNCAAEYGSVRSSFHTTICVLEGLLEHERAAGGCAESVSARRRGEEYLLQRGLFRRLSTGEVIEQAWFGFSFPNWWHYDVLRALDYFRGTGNDPDPRLAEAVEVVRSKEQRGGTWLLENTHPGAVHFAMEDGDGRPSRWNTLRALRILELAQPLHRVNGRSYVIGRMVTASGHRAVRGTTISRSSKWLLLLSDCGDARYSSGPEVVTKDAVVALTHSGTLRSRGVSAPPARRRPRPKLLRPCGELRRFTCETCRPSRFLQPEAEVPPATDPPIRPLWAECEEGVLRRAGRDKGRLHRIDSAPLEQLASPQSHQGPLSRHRHVG